TIGLTGITSGGNENQALIVSAASSNPALIPNPTVNYSTGSSGTLTFAPVADGNGSATITITVNDGDPRNNLVSRGFLVTVNPINDPPQISSIPNQSVLEHTPAGPITFAIADVDTPLDEIILSASSSNPTLAPARSIVFAG